MSEENVEIVRKALDAYSRGDLQATLEHMAPEAEFRPSGLFMDTQTVYRGPNGWVEFWHRFRDAWESIAISVDRIEDLGEQVLVLGTFHGIGSESAIEVTRESGWLLTIRNGLVVQIRSFASWAETLEAAGLSE
jgi:ketosteroid isomerase-like protein